MQWFQRAHLKVKILLPLAIVSIIMSVMTYAYFSNLYTDSRTEELLTKARAVLYSAESAREYGGEQHKAQIFQDFTQSTEFQSMSPEQKRSRILYTVPVFAAMKVAEKKSAELHFTFKAPRLDGQRNPDNKPDEFEAEALRKLQTGLAELSAIDEKENKLRYFRPVRLSNECLGCHGDPANSITNDGKDILGYHMEGKKAGDMHGAFEVIMPLDALRADVRNKSLLIALISLAGLIAILAIGYIVCSLVLQQINRLKHAARKVADGDTSVELEVATQDEVGQLTMAFNDMTNGIRAANAAKTEYLNEKVGELLVQMQHFSQGDLTVSIDVKSDDALGRLYAGFNQAVANVRAMIVQVQSVVENTAASAGQISSATEQLAAGSQEQSVQTSEVAAAVEQMNSTILENARTATSTSEIARHSGNAARSGGAVVEKMVLKISDIASVMKSSSDMVTRLGNSSNQIGEIVSVIDDIADQTNLLALNAAIEAARAGDQGRGFAVVADEVRKLAERTTQATKQIAQMIKGIQQETQQAVTMMDRGNEEVNEGIELASDSGTALKEIVNAAEELVQMISQIAAASEEQSSTSEQMARNIDGISQVASDSARAVTEISYTATKLHEQTDALREMILQFRVDNQTLPSRTEKIMSNGNGHNNGHSNGNGYSNGHSNSNGNGYRNGHRHHNGNGYPKLQEAKNTQNKVYALKSLN
jgi:methyl-accepting chemotaxis protein